MKEKADTYIKIAEIYMRMENADEARLYVKKALLCAEKHDTIPYGAQRQSVLCGCERYGYVAMHSGRSVHPYGRLKKMLIASMKTNSIFDDIISDIEA